MSPRKKVVSITEALCVASPPIERGVVCIIVRDASLMLYVRSLTELHFLSAISVVDVPLLPRENVVALYRSASRDAGFAKVLVRNSTTLTQRADKLEVVQLDNCRSFSPLSNEGVHLVLTRLTRSGCVSAEQSIPDLPHDQVVDAMNRLDAGSRQRNGLVLLFLHCSPNYDATWLKAHCDEVFVVDKCEPGPGASVAFSMTALSMESQHGNGIGRMMFEIDPNGSHWSFASSIFIATKAEDRAMWFARREGEYLETIGEWMGGLSKSTVKRRLDNLPLRIDIDADVDPPEGWREDWFQFLGWVDAEDDGEENDGEDDDEDDLLDRRSARPG